MLANSQSVNLRFKVIQFPNHVVHTRSQAQCQTEPERHSNARHSRRKKRCCRERLDFYNLVGEKNPQVRMAFDV